MRPFFYLLLAWFPFDRSLAFDVGFMTLTPYYVGIVLLTIWCITQVLMNRERYQANGTDLAIVFVCVMYLASTALSKDPRVAGLLAVTAIFIPTLTYFVARTLLQGEASIHYALIAIGGGVVVISVASVIEFLAREVRAEPFGVDSVSIASLAILPLMAGLYGKIRSPIKGFRWLLVIAGALAVAVSISRAYWIFCALSPFLFWLFIRGRALAVVSAIMAVSLGLTLAIALDTSLVGPVNIDYTQDRGLERVLDPDHWKAALYNRAVYMFEPSINTFLESPVFGEGLFIHRFMGTTTHNIHLEWLESGGLLGYVAFLATYLTHFRRLGRRGKPDYLACAIGLASLGILVNGVTNGIMHSVMPTCAMLCLGMTGARLQGLGRRAGRPLDMRWVPYRAGPSGGDVPPRLI